MRILVTTSPAYAHILPDFTRAFMRVWPDCPWPVTVISAGAGGNDSLYIPAWRIEMARIAPRWLEWRTVTEGWVDSLFEYLGRSREPFLLLLEDYILDAVDWPTLAICADLIETNERIGMIRVHPVPGPLKPDPGAMLGQIAKDDPYSISLQPAMWRPEVCWRFFEPGETIWRTEINGSQRAAAMEDSSFYSAEFLSVYRSALGYRNLMRRGVEQSDVREWISSHLSERTVTP